MIELVWQPGKGLGNYARLFAIQEALAELEIPSILTTRPELNVPRGYDVWDKKALGDNCLLVMDNWGEGHYDGCVVVSTSPYSHFTGNSCFLRGTRYAALRSSFWEELKPPPIRETPEHIFSYHGCSSASPPKTPLNWWTAEDLARYDLGIVHGGLIVYELLRVGIPVISCPQNKEQKLNVEFLANTGTIKLAHNKEETADLTSPRRLEMQTRGQKLVDGQGARRIAQHVKDYL